MLDIWKFWIPFQGFLAVLCEDVSQFRTNFFQCSYQSAQRLDVYVFWEKLCSYCSIELSSGHAHLIFIIMSIENNRILICVGHRACISSTRLRTYILDMVNAPELGKEEYFLVNLFPHKATLT